MQIQKIPFAGPRKRAAHLAFGPIMTDEKIEVIESRDVWFSKSPQVTVF